MPASDDNIVYRTVDLKNVDKDSEDYKWVKKFNIARNKYLRNEGIDIYPDGVFLADREQANVYVIASKGEDVIAGGQLIFREKMAPEDSRYESSRLGFEHDVINTRAENVMPGFAHSTRQGAKVGELKGLYCEDYLHGFGIMDEVMSRLAKEAFEKRGVVALVEVGGTRHASFIELLAQRNPTYFLPAETLNLSKLKKSLTEGDPVHGQSKWENLDMSENEGPLSTYVSTPVKVNKGFFRGDFIDVTVGTKDNTAHWAPYHPGQLRIHTITLDKAPIGSPERELIQQYNKLRQQRNRELYGENYQNYPDDLEDEHRSPPNTYVIATIGDNKVVGGVELRQERLLAKYEGERNVRAGKDFTQSDLVFFKDLVNVQHGKQHESDHIANESGKNATKQLIVRKLLPRIQDKDMRRSLVVGEIKGWVRAEGTDTLKTEIDMEIFKRLKGALENSKVNIAVDHSTALGTSLAQRMAELYGAAVRTDMSIEDNNLGGTVLLHLYPIKDVSTERGIKKLAVEDLLPDADKKNEVDSIILPKIPLGVSLKERQRLFFNYDRLKEEYEAQTVTASQLQRNDKQELLTSIICAATNCDAAQIDNIRLKLPADRPIASSCPEYVVSEDTAFSLPTLSFTLSGKEYALIIQDKEDRERGARYEYLRQMRLAGIGFGEETAKSRFLVSGKISVEAMLIDPAQGVDFAARMESAQHQFHITKAEQETSPLDQAMRLAMQLEKSDVGMNMKTRPSRLFKKMAALKESGIIPREQICAALDFYAARPSPGSPIAGCANVPVIGESWKGLLGVRDDGQLVVKRMPALEMGIRLENVAHVFVDLINYDSVSVKDESFFDHLAMTAKLSHQEKKGLGVFCMAALELTKDEGKITDGKYEKTKSIITKRLAPEAILNIRNGDHRLYLGSASGMSREL